MLAGYKQAKLNPLELNQLKWILGGLLGLLSVSTLFGLPANSAPVVVLSLIIGIGAISVPTLCAKIPESFWKVLVPVLVVIVIADFFLAQPDIIAPLLRMVVMLTTIRILQQRRKREDLQLILLCLFMVVISGVMTLSLAFAVQIFLFAVGAMALLFVVNLVEFSRISGETVVNVWEHFRWKRFLTRLYHHIDSKQLGLASVLFLALVGISAIIFILTPRLEVNQQLSFLDSGRSQSMAGFSDSVEFGEVVNIIEDDGIAFRVDVPSDLSGHEAPYWRMVALDEYARSRNGRPTFRMSDSARSDPTAATRERIPLPEGYRRTGDGSWGTWTFYVSPGVSRYLPSVGTPEAYRFQGRQETISYRTLGVVGIPEPSARTFFFQLEQVDGSDVMPFSFIDTQLIGAGVQVVDLDQRNPNPRLQYPFTTLAVPNDKRTAEYLNNFLNELVGAEERLRSMELAARVTHALQSRHSYSLSSSIPSGEGDLLVRWMDSDQPGHCELFAGAFTLVMRFAGVPTRVVTGFRGGIWNGYEDYYMVRNRDAHAWVEVFDPEAGWVRHDPTPGYGRMSEDERNDELLGSVGVDNTWKAYLDSLMVLWYRRVVNFDQSAQQEMASNLKEGLKLMYEDVKQSIIAKWEATKEWFKKPWSLSKLQAVGQFVLVLGLGAVMLLGIRKFYKNWFLKHTSKGRNTLENKTRKKASELLKKLDRYSENEQVRMLRRELKAVRFGPLDDSYETGSLFKRVRGFLRRAKP